MVKPYLNQIGGVVNDDVSLFTGGLNTYTDKAFLESDQMPYVMNMTMRQPPAIQTRNSRSTLANMFDTQKLPWNSMEITNMWAKDQDLVYFIRKEDALTYHLCMLKKNGVTGKYDYSVIHTDTEGNYEGVQFAYGRTQTEEFLYLGNEQFKARMVLGAENPIAQYTDAYVDHFGFPCWHKARLWLLRPSEGIVEWSNSLMPDDFLIGFDDPDAPTRYGDSGTLPITSLNGRGKLTGLTSFDDKLIVFNEHSVTAIYGSSGVYRWSDTKEQDPNYFQPVDLIGRVGCLSPNHFATSAGRLYWFGDDKQIYEYTGSSINIISRPGKTRNSTLSIGGIDNVLNHLNVTNVEATSTILYVDTAEGYMFVFDAYNRVWWCEDGGFTALTNYSQSTDNLLMAKSNGDILSYDNLIANTGRDEIYNWETETADFEDIEFEFHTRVYGAEGTDLRKSLSDVWFQMFCTNGYGDVYINDIWCEYDIWRRSREVAEERYKKIGHFAANATRGSLELYQPQTYEQRYFPVEKMFGQRLNTFQVIVKGKLFAKFFLMKREWRAR